MHTLPILGGKNQPVHIVAYEHAWSCEIMKEITIAFTIIKVEILNRMPYQN